ncbi:hypothetical protein [Flavobacterium sp. NRK1]|uniref:hypothetical protein n=1 Tax=Flavobacterium sp. NRK1 TaxID=2954929 RepID=UPI002093FB0A|nr:hypothetical protein [Flavobacterium sp. NRK1]MCO6148975.1 hypothetical protein [Flavobacterium sp. NRK1]
MFTEFTWAAYLRVTAAVLFLYYTILLLKFYFPQIRAAAGAPFHSMGNPDSAEPNATSAIMESGGNLTPIGEFQQTVTDYEIIEELVDRVKKSLIESFENKADQQTVTNGLKAIVNDYPVLGQSTFRPSINEFIATESQQHGFTFMNETLAETLWQTK